jgi:hypothetical protein
MKTIVALIDGLPRRLSAALLIPQEARAHEVTIKEGRW